MVEERPARTAAGMMTRWTHNYAVEDKRKSMFLGTAGLTSSSRPAMDTGRSTGLDTYGSAVESSPTFRGGSTDRDLRNIGSMPIWTEKVSPILNKRRSTNLPRVKRNTRSGPQSPNKFSHKQDSSMVLGVR